MFKPFYKLNAKINIFYLFIVEILRCIILSPKKSLRPTICMFPCPVCAIDKDKDLFEEATRSTFYCPACGRRYICNLPLGKIQIGDEIRYICPIDHTDLDESPFRAKEIELLIKYLKEEESQ